MPMLIKSADFIKSSSSYKDCPEMDKHEFGFIGRSNVGKSSLINLLTNRKSLAKISGKPGKTQLINHFLINESWYLVDLPGYGWAKTSKEKKYALGQMTKDFLLKGKSLVLLFVLIDSRLNPQEIDLSFTQWAGTNGIPICLVFTKSDKQTRTRTYQNVEKFKEKMLSEWEELPPYFITSSKNGEGKEEIMNYIEKVLSDL